jgi:hypothetical protein
MKDLPERLRPPRPKSEPKRIADLTFDEAVGAVRAILGADDADVVLDFVLETLELSIANSDISDLLYWRDAWFDDDSKRDVELTAEQIVGYAMQRSQRRLVGAPDHLVLPFPVFDRDVH